MNYPYLLSILVKLFFYFILHFHVDPYKLQSSYTKKPNDKMQFPAQGPLE